MDDNKTDRRTKTDGLGQPRLSSTRSFGAAVAVRAKLLALGFVTEATPRQNDGGSGRSRAVANPPFVAFGFVELRTA